MVTIRRRTNKLAKHFPSLSMVLYNVARPTKPRLCHFYRDSSTFFVHIFSVVLAIKSERKRETANDIVTPLNSRSNLLTSTDKLTFSQKNIPSTLLYLEKNWSKLIKYILSYIYLRKEKNFNLS